MEIREVPPQEAPINLLLEADPSVKKINSYLTRSRCMIANIQGETLGVYIVLQISPGVYELMNIAISPDHQQKGIGLKLLKHAIATVNKWGASRLEVGTGAFGYQLAFYQREGFRVFAVERDFFLKNYEEPIYEASIQHKDMLRLAIDVLVTI